MKTTKFLTVALGLFLVGNVNVVLAQEENMEKNDSIYGLDNTLLQGQWEIVQVTVEKNTDEKIDTTVYNTTTEVQSFILCPNEWVINEHTIVWRYFNGAEIAFEYTFGENQLTIKDGTPPMQSYQYNIQGEKLILTTYYRVNNPPIHMDEKWTIVLNKHEMTSFIDETENDADYVFRYFFLTGIESRNKPIGVPFVQQTYKNGSLISVNRYFVER